MNILNLPWKWDRVTLPPTDVTMSVIRWRRGPVTFYKYTWLSDNSHTWWIYLWDDFGFGIQLPIK